MQTGYFIFFGLLGLLLAGAAASRAEETSFIITGASTPFDPVFSPAIGPGEADPSMPLAISVNQDYLTHEPQQTLRHVETGTGTAEPLQAENNYTAETPDQEEASATTSPRQTNAGSNDNVISALLSFFSFLEPEKREDTVLAHAEPATDFSNNLNARIKPQTDGTQRERPFVADKLFTSGLRPGERNPQTFAQAKPVNQETTAAQLPENKQPSKSYTATETVDIPSAKPGLLTFLTELFSSRIDNETKPQTASVSAIETVAQESERKPEPDPMSALLLESSWVPEVVYGYTEEGVSVASLDLTAPTKPSRDISSEYMPEHMPELTSGLTPETFTEPPKETFQVSEQDEIPATSPKQKQTQPAKPKATISRGRPEPTFVNAVTAFFSNSAKAVHIRRGKPGDREHTEFVRKQQHQETTVQALAEPEPGVQPEIIVTSTRLTEQEPTLLASIDASGLKTPLVDAAIAKGQGSMDTNETGFVIDVPVPVSDTITLKEEQLVLGAEGKLGRALPFADDPGGHCVRRRSGRTWICLESLGWPSVIAEAFDRTGGRTHAIIRYDNDAATQYRVSFPADSFDRVAAHFEYLLGAPNERPTVMVPLFAQPKKSSRILRWIAEDTGQAPPAILEMREIDDVRWSESPDVKNGVVRLYRRGMKPVFSMVMTAELNLIDIRHKTSDIPAFTTAP